MPTQKQRAEPLHSPQHQALAEALGRIVRDRRARRDLTRRQLASVADVSERYLAELEGGHANVSLGILGRVAHALGEDVAMLVVAAAEAAPGGLARSARMTAPAVCDRLASLAATLAPSERDAAADALAAWLRQRRQGLRGIALIGLRGAGKSTLGRLLAERRGLAFVSVTREIEARAGLGLTELFNLGGPDAYRTLENEVLADIVERPDPIVLETAGGVVGNGEALDVILGRFRTVWLKASPEEHLARVAGQGDTRPMQGNPRALEHLKALLAAREPEYQRAEWHLETGGRSVEDCLAELDAIAAPVVG